MNEQELNKKLAEWVGIDIEAEAKREFISSVREYRGRGYIGNETWERDCEEWRKEAHREDVTPDFTQSLDACFKWLMPEAKKRLGKVDYYRLLIQWVNDFTQFNLEPALALCGLIEKLIDELP